MTIKYLSLDTILTFGKHKGSTIQEVIEESPTYIEWAIDEIDWFELDDLASQHLAESISELLYTDKHEPPPYNNWE